MDVITMGCYDVILYGVYLPVDLHHQQRPEADVTHSISVLPGFLGLS
jgi:hypothetical protein